MIGRLFKRKSAAPEAEKTKAPKQEKAPNKAAKAPAEKGGEVKKSRNRRRKPKPKKPAAPWDISQFQVEPAEGKTRFHDLNLNNDLMHGIADLGFQYCSPIQAQSLPHSLDGHDVVGKAQTGTGKTAAFLLTIIDDLLRNPLEGERYAGEARALVIAPTRELVLQIADDAKALVKHTDLQVHTLVGGMDYGKQQRRLEESYVDILVATPGRLLDFCGNRDVHLDQLEIMVIDEADRMLDMGFIPQVRRIIRQTPKKTHRQTLLFSATFTQDVLNLAEQWTIDPVMIEIEPESVATETVTQKVYMLATEEKYTLLYNVLKQDDVESLIVFANRRDQCRRLHEKLEAHGFKVGILSGDVPQNKRVKTLEGFKSGQLNVLVATDVAGRGIHIDGISHVVNYTLPEEPEDYVHRIGRTGRAGKSGTSISLACEDDALRLEPIETLLGDKLKCEVPPENLLEAHPPLPARKRQSNQGQGQQRSRSGGRRR
ncbi:ATP-dependent RNA helicase RhlB [Pseudoteredinibacter isoporae]|uniref:ATP-dependent RNA helicase RhlB n=1 Tax=Pseudoteredinibacter isoporae TaxID=570281 RepID=A0A7X0JVA0_9GAMM|nr:ATP-dependent RNA helicase RhlB [Pseudoteredinibacter isoporae]MBB6522449.1 ATP-dependent RNA helicase RhlB [Pseudoteredinibacter isoporae]NHO87979.1 ATP-dependent RNA helicase RhlB [Pseudoteredinibacter isoporae]NIB23690.1 ATP-dependent RNA helicase RhlB [Pseudoteredinibacter isoporae]